MGARRFDKNKIYLVRFGHKAQRGLFYCKLQECINYLCFMYTDNFKKGHGSVRKKNRKLMALAIFVTVSVIFSAISLGSYQAGVKVEEKEVEIDVAALLSTSKKYKK
jgi:hypothetical protein